MSGGAMRKMAVYLGLVEDQGRYDEHGEYIEYDSDAQAYESEQREPAPVATLADRRPLPATPAAAPATVAPTELSRITTLQPRTYNEARTVGEHFRDGTPVIMNLSEMDGDAKRLVDFAAGLTFGLHGTIERISAQVFLLSPANVSVTAEAKQRVAQSGFFNQS